MMNPGVRAGAVRGKTLSALYRSDAVLGVHTGYFYEHFDKKKKKFPCGARLCSGMFRQSLQTPDVGTRAKKGVRDSASC